MTSQSRTRAVEIAESVLGAVYAVGGTNLYAYTPHCISVVDSERVNLHITYPVGVFVATRGREQKKTTGSCSALQTWGLLGASRLKR